MALGAQTLQVSRLFGIKLIIICLAWIDGTAILIAVAVVSGVGSTVDWRKEIEFVKRTNEDSDQNIVSSYFDETVR